MQSNSIYIICLLVGMIVKGGINSFIFPYIMKIYGMKYCIEVGGVLSIIIILIKEGGIPPF